MSIHHATKTKATKLGITLTETDTGSVFFTSEDGVISPDYDTGKEALDAAIAMLEEDDANSDDQDVGDDEDDEEAIPSSIVRAVYRTEYKARGDASTCGDEIAYAMKEFLTGSNDAGKIVMDHSALRRLAEDNDLIGKIDDTWAHLNPGQKRMNLGNMLRARYKKGELVMIGGAEWKLAEEDVAEAA